MIIITLQAAEQIRTSAQHAGIARACLRLAARLGDKGSIEYGMGFDDKAADDMQVVAHDVTVLISPGSVELLTGAPQPVTMPLNGGSPNRIFRCPTCQVAVWSEYGGRTAVRFVRGGTLDDPAVVSPDVHMFTTVKMEREETSNPQAMVRGILEPAFLVHSQVSVIEGRAPLPGRDEILVGKLAAQKLGVPIERLSVGNTVFFDDRTWTISGVFAAPGSVMESEIWCPLTDLQIAAYPVAAPFEQLWLGLARYWRKKTN